MRAAILLTLVLAGCVEPDRPLVLNADRWTCTEQRVISFKPLMQECVTYRKLQ